VSVTGIDIDETLIRAAWKRRRNLWSLQQPLEDEESSSSLAESANYFPASCLHIYGPLPLPPREGSASFPHNLTFKTQDWMDSSIAEGDNEEYDVILALSITKWIHLNHGDDGVKSFFQRVFSFLSPGGLFLLEAQGWDGYSKAKRMSEALKQNFKTLHLRPEDFHELLIKLGFQAQTSFEGDASAVEGFQRRLDVYLKPK
jgi:7SK snRNA methylphosphate capping enzyme